MVEKGSDDVKTMMRVFVTSGVLLWGLTLAQASPPRCHIDSVDCDARILDNPRNCSEGELAHIFDGCPIPPAPSPACPAVVPASPQPYFVCRHRRNNCGASRATGRLICRRCRVYFP